MFFILICFPATFEIAEDYPLFQAICKVNVTDEDIAHGDRLTVGGHFCGRCIYFHSRHAGHSLWDIL